MSKIIFFEDASNHNSDGHLKFVSPRGTRYYVIILRLGTGQLITKLLCGGVEGLSAILTVITEN